jgi:glycosyltransferase involved in cell wall biosynthesis
MGHEVGIFAYFGLMGSKLDWNGIPIYPNNGNDYGVNDHWMFYEDYKPDILLTLTDTWVLSGLDPRVKWIPWTPIDHEPAPPRVLNSLRQIAFVKAIAMSKFGQAELQKHGIPSYYIPLSVNTQLFAPREDLRKRSREIAGWTDKFVIGSVAVNCPRKNFPIAMQAVQKFATKHKDIIYYMHTNPFDSQGYRLTAIREALDMKAITFFPPPTEMITGITRETMAQMYNSLDVFLLPSKGEGFCLPAIESQACGVPVIISDNTALPEILGGGWLLKEKRLEWTGQDSWNYDCSIDEIVEYLEQAYQAKKDGTLDEMKAKAREKALEYSEDIILSMWPPVLKDIEQRIKEPKNCEGLVPWKLYFIPKECTPAKVLDIGCGVNQPYRDTLEQLGEYVGIDIKDGPKVVHMDAHHLDFKDKEFGFVWMSEMLEHVEDPKQVIAEAKRVGVHGICLFSTAADRTCFDADPDHREVKDMEYTTIAGGDGLISW